MNNCYECGEKDRGAVGNPFGLLLQWCDPSGRKWRDHGGQSADGGYDRENRRGAEGGKHP